ncbi:MULTISPECIES: phosphatidylserine decarboxylase [unclassified Kaistella]|uniref:phosphatidylserine decarboxylase n=1 Tax=unclassified Kaistella TaxID=2762626 RepID=UPI002734460A|nr:MULTISPECIES: phosphatidylserine decarboxylase [unclassified Kaistella]MDP2454422.1 phosphatidylserine decarboxylase [Kaistella sp. SH11-4b]MDP2457909.1 phosphatidylserine decarboxylase [Kaistella sp. SH40-3]MDP2460815.1 phosphatidylserine decarboxylase [Kaistella sp. SH19-2b]
MKFKKPNKKWTIIWFISALIFVLAVFPVPAQKPIKYVDRETGQVLIENVYGEKWLDWLYHNPVGEATLWTIAKRKLITSLYGDEMEKPASADKIVPFVKEYGVDLSIAQKQNFTSFNDFFIRKLKPEARPIVADSLAVASPADGKILAYENIKNADFYIKGFRFNVNTFLNNPDLAKKYEDGTMIVFRLAPPDYHRYHFPISGTTGSSNIKINGDYYSVNPLALRKKAEIFWLNKREYGVMKSPLFGDVVMVEVGATMVGSMIQTYTGTTVKKGEEKGYFKFGGSTVVLLFEKDKIKIDNDLLMNTSKGLETTIKMGERIAIQK